MKNHKFLLFAITVFGTTSVFAQTTNWMHRSDTNIGYDNCQHLTVDNQGNSYIMGTAVDTIDMDPSSNVVQLVPDNSPQTNRNLSYIQKIDAQGNVVWTDGWQATGNTSQADVVISNDPFLYIAGSFDDSLKVGINSTQNSYFTPNDGSYLIKMDLNGNIISTTIFDTGSDITVKDFSIDSDNNFLFAGTFRSTANFTLNGGTANNLISAGLYDGFIAKYDASLNLIWTYHYGSGTFDNMDHITTDSNNNVYAAGSILTSVDMDPSSGSTIIQPYNSTLDAFILKLNANGDFQWVKQVASATFAAAMDIKCGPNDNVYVTGDFKENVVFDYPTNTNFQDIYFNDCFIWKLDSNGNTGWSKAIGGNNIDHLGRMSIRGNQLSIAGRLTDSTNLDTPSNPYYVDDLTSGIAVNYDLSGNFISAIELMGGLSEVYDVELVNGGILMAGAWNSTADFDFSSGTNNLSTYFQDDLFLVNLGVAFASISQKVDLRGINVYPNPVQKGMAIKLSQDFETVSVYDIYGKLVYTSDQLQPIQKSGLYILNFITKKGIASKKLIVE